MSHCQVPSLAASCASRSRCTFASARAVGSPLARDVLAEDDEAGHVAVRSEQRGRDHSTNERRAVGSSQAQVAPPHVAAEDLGERVDLTVGGVGVHDEVGETTAGEIVCGTAVQLGGGVVGKRHPSLAVRCQDRKVERVDELELVDVSLHLGGLLTPGARHRSSLILPLGRRRRSETAGCLGDDRILLMSPVPGEESVAAASQMVQTCTAPGRPDSTTNDANVDAGASGRLTVGTIRRSVRPRGPVDRAAHVAAPVAVEELDVRVVLDHRPVVRPVDLAVAVGA